MSARVVDYSPLLVTPTPQEVAEYRAKARASGAPWAGTPLHTVFAVLLGVFLFCIVGIPALLGVLAGLTSSYRAGGTSVGGIAAVIGLAVVFAAVIFAVVQAIRSGGGQWERWLRLDRFAAANGLVFSPSDADPQYPGAIFAIGDSRRATDHLRTADGRFLDFGNYQYSTGAGKSRRTHIWGFLALNLDRNLPHMVLDARGNNGLFGASNLPATFTKDQVLKLEGDFNEYFTLYCPKQYERDALYVFTPDLMALLIDEAAPFDVEIVDNWMFVYSNQPFRSGNPAVYQRLFRIVETVGAKTLTQTVRYHDDRPAAPFVANIVAPQGARLQRAARIGAIVLAVVVALVLGWIFAAGFFFAGP